MQRRSGLLLLCVCFLCRVSLAAEPPAPGSVKLVRSVQSGAWSNAATWEGREIPGHGVQVQVRSGHTVTYDVQAPESLIIRALFVAGTVSFATDKSTQLNVGLIKIVASDSTEEEGFDCEMHLAAPDPKAARASLLVGTPLQPVAANATALIRLTYVPGMNKESCPAIVCCGGRMDFHGAPLSRTWVKLGARATKGATEVTLAEPVTGWKVGDQVIVTATEGDGDTEKTTEPRTITAIDGTRIRFDVPLIAEHLGEGVNGVGPDARHPFVVRNTKIWNVHYGLRPQVPSLLVENMTIQTDYGIYHPDDYRTEPPLTGDESRVTEVSDIDFPQLLDPIDDLPPATVMTHVTPREGQLLVQGTCSDNTSVKRVLVNGQAARATSDNFATWEVTLDRSGLSEIIAHGEDAAGNIEQLAHTLSLAEWQITATK